MSGAGGLLAWGVALAAPLVALAGFRQGLERKTGDFIAMIAVFGTAAGVIAAGQGTGAAPGAGFVLWAGLSAGVVSAALFALGHKLGRKP